MDRDGSAVENFQKRNFLSLGRRRERESTWKSSSRALKGPPNADVTAADLLMVHIDSLTLSLYFLP